jgi:hypothetical protein
MDKNRRCFFDYQYSIQQRILLYQENDHEVSCEGILYFGAQGVPKLNLDNREAQSFERLLDVLCEEFEIIDTIEPK